MLAYVAAWFLYWFRYIMSDELKKDILIMIAFGVVYYLAFFLYVSNLGRVW